MLRVLSIVAGLAGAATLSQFPEFSQQYVQRLGGAVQELRVIAVAFDASARSADLTRAQALNSLQGNRFLDQHGTDMRGTLTRYDRLSADLAALDGGAVERLVALPMRIDPELAQQTWDAYEPAVPLTGIGAVFSGGGFALGWVLIALLRRPFQRRKTA